MATALSIKNMVCNRCVMAVDSVLKALGLHPQSVTLGEAKVTETLSPEQMETVRTHLSELGFELLDDRRQQVIDRIRKAVIGLVRRREDRPARNLSEVVAAELHQDYSTLSRLFSEVTGKTIERYYMEQRIERVKELIRYDEMTLTEIAYQLDYSSVAYLSSQFKTVTGMTPTRFKALKENTRRPIDEI